MDPHTDVTMPEGDLPMVRHGFPWPLRVAFGMLGVFAVVMPVWELGRGLWPLSIATPVFAIIIGGAASIGIAMLLISFTMLLAINIIQVWSRRRIGYV